MTLTRPGQHHFDPASTADRQSNALAGLAVALLLVVVGLYLVETLRRCGDAQDCILSGRAACVQEVADVGQP